MKFIILDPSHKTSRMRDYDENTERDNDFPVQLAHDAEPYLKLKAPMNVNPKMESASRNVLSRDEYAESQHENDRHLDSVHQDKQTIQRDVIQKPMEIDSVMGMYIVALVAGISAAITVGLISLGIAWYT